MNETESSKIQFQTTSEHTSETEEPPLKVPKNLLHLKQNFILTQLLKSGIIGIGRYVVV